MIIAWWIWTWQNLMHLLFFFLFLSGPYCSNHSTLALHLMSTHSTRSSHVSTTRNNPVNLQNQNITELLDSLLYGYNRHLRPGFGGKFFWPAATMQQLQAPWSETGGGGRQVEKIYTKWRHLVESSAHTSLEYPKRSKICKFWAIFIEKRRSSMLHCRYTAFWPFSVE